jgi:hypothetical protein
LLLVQVLNAHVDLSCTRFTSGSRDRVGEW